MRITLEENELFAIIENHSISKEIREKLYTQYNQNKSADKSKKQKAMNAAKAANT